MRLIPILILIPLFIACEVKETSVVESITSKLDSLNLIESCGEPNCSIADSLERSLTDSLYNIDSTNYTAIISKLFLLQKEKKYKESTVYCKKAIAHDSANVRHKLMSMLFIGTYLETINELDSAKVYYEQMVPLVNDVDFAPWLEPQLMTVLKGQKSGFDTMKDTPLDSSSLYFQYLINDIRHYQNEGLKGFFPLYDKGVEYKSFSIIIPEELYKSKLNSMQKVSLFFTRQGVNVQASGHYSSERRYVIRTLPKYVDQLLNINEFEIEEIE